MSFLKDLFNLLPGTHKNQQPERSKPVPQTAEEANRLHNEKMGVLLADEADSLIKGVEYCATLQLRTPLRILSLDGTTLKDGEPPVAEEPWHGVWVPQVKTFRELGLDLDEISEGDSSSDIGYVKRSEYLQFLKDIRRAVEADESIKCRIEALRLVMREKKYAKFVKKHQGQNQLIDIFFPPILNSIPGINTFIALALREAKITTVHQLRKKTDKDLLTIKGVGPVALMKIREFTDNYCGNDALDKLDSVER